VTLQDLLGPHLDMLVHRVNGPMAFRFIVQPTVAVFLAIRAGLRDARAGRAPYFFWPAIVDPAHHRDQFRRAWEDVGKVFMVAWVLDVVYTLMVYRWVYPVQSLIVACALAMIPYLLVRGPVIRIVRIVQRP